MNNSVKHDSGSPFPTAVSNTPVVAKTNFYSLLFRIQNPILTSVCSCLSPPLICQHPSFCFHRCDRHRWPGSLPVSVLASHGLFDDRKSFFVEMIFFGPSKSKCDFVSGASRGIASIYGKPTVYLTTSLSRSCLKEKEIRRRQWWRRRWMTSACVDKVNLTVVVVVGGVSCHWSNRTRFRHCCFRIPATSKNDELSSFKDIVVSLLKLVCILIKFHMPSERRSICDDYEENVFFSTEKEPFVFLLLLLFTMQLLYYRLFPRYWNTVVVRHGISALIVVLASQK
jgi:hypothetical protein